MHLITDLWCEQVVGNFSQRNHLAKIEDPKSNLDYDCYGKELLNAFHSVYMFSDKMREHVERNNSIKGYDGPISSHALYWDLDSEDELSKAQEDAKELVDRLYQMGADEENIQVFFSGNKGFHIFLSSYDIRKYNGSEGLHNLIKGVCSEIAEGLETFDTAVYDKTRLIRLANSKHPKSGLYKIPLNQYDLMHLSPEEIKEMAKEQIENEWKILPCRIDFIEQSLSALVSNGVANTRQLKTSAKDVLDGITNGFSDGNRDTGLTSLAGLLHSRNFSLPYQKAILMAINNQGDDPLPERDINRIIDSVQHYSIMNEFVEPQDDDFITMRQAGEKWMYIKKNRQNLKSGFQRLDDELYIFDQGKVMLLAARSGVGKTCLGMQIADSIAKNLNGINLFCTLEMASQAVFYRAAKIDSSKEGEDYDNRQMTELLYTNEEMREKVYNNWAHTIMVDKDSLTIQQIENYFIKAQQKYDGAVKVLLVDYIGLIENTDDYKALSKVARELKKVAKRLNTRIIMLAQLSRLAGDGTIEPTLNMLRDSGALEEAADMVLGMWCEPENLLRIHCKFVKNREGTKGACFDLLQHGLAYECADFCQGNINPKPGKNWTS